MSTRAPRVAGVDTRDATATPTVRAAARTAALVAGPGWIAAFAAPAYWKRWITFPNGVQPWLVIGLIFLGLLAALAGWRRDPFPSHARGRVIPLGGDTLLVLAVLAMLATAPRDPEFIAVLLPCAPILAGWTIGRAARLAAEACVPLSRAAAGGIVTLRGLLGLFVAGHLALVLKGSGSQRAAVWAFAYLALGLVSFARAGRFLARDRARADLRVQASSVGVPESRRGSVFVCDGITVQFGATTVLRTTSLTAAAGEVVALVGGNGAGKSTLLRVAAGLLTPTGGRVFVGGEDVSELLPEERAATGLAFVSGARPVFPDMTVLENLRVAGFRTHITPRSFDAATDAIFDLVPVLAPRREAKAGVLSGGEQRLLAVAQTLYRKPKVLLADELSLGLDADARIAVLDLLRLLADQDVSVVVVDHDLPALLPRADRAALLAAGSVTDFVPAEKILELRTDLLPATFLAGAAS